MYVSIVYFFLFRYFSAESTQEILDEFFPKLEVLENGKYSASFEMLSILLNPINGYELWLDKFITIWSHYNNAPFTMVKISIYY